MLNRVILMGRITQDLELKATQNDVAVLSFTIAIDRNYAKRGEERQTDFISCVAWRQQAEFISRYFAKGRMIAIEGTLRTRTYEDKNGSRHYVTEVYVDNTSFTGEKAQQSATGNQKVSYPAPQNNNQEKQAKYASYDEPSNTPITIGNMTDFDMGGFEEILSDDGVPF